MMKEIQTFLVDVNVFLPYHLKVNYTSAIKCINVLDYTKKLHHYLIVNILFSESQLAKKCTFSTFLANKQIKNNLNDY